MNGSLAVRGVMRHEYVGVNEGDSVAGAAELMHEEGVTGALVVRGSDPVGLITASDVVAVVARGDDPEITDVGEAMRRPVTTVDPDADLTEAVEAMVDRGVGRLAVVSEGELVGMVAERDIVTAPNTLSPMETPEVSAPADPAREHVGRDVEHQDTTYTTQGVCEVCGALSRSLDPHNGQLLCEECRAM